MNRITWLVNRFRVMSVREVLFRLQRALLQLVERYRVSAGWQPLPATAVRSRFALFGTDPDLGHKWQRSFRLDTDRLQEYITGRINFFGHGALDIGMPVDWHRDPMTRIVAPREFGKSLNYRDDRLVGNIKFTWELGRHQHLVPLATAYAVTGDLKYREAISAQIDGWIDENPYAIGIHWCSALEVSLRLVSWSLIHSLLVLRDGKQGLFACVSDQERVGIAIYQQAHFVRHFLSGYSSANNHLVGELCGLWVACQTFDLGAQGHEWGILAHEGLERESRLQVSEDGVDREQASYYHLWVLEYFLFSWLVGMRSGEVFSEDFTNTVLAMARFLEDISPNGGEPPQLGDADDGFVARFVPSWSRQPYRELLSAVHAVFGTVNMTDFEKAFWYRAMLPSDELAFPKLGWHRNYPAIYPQGGYIIMGGANCHLVSDAGPLGYLGIAAHGHADALSFCLAIDDAWWLVDPGTYAYHSAPEWRSYFRGTSAHNTIRVNGLDQSRMGGAFMWLQKARTIIMEYHDKDNYQYIKACHDGYHEAGITHVRELCYSPLQREVECRDTLEGKEAQVAEIFFHFSPEIHLSRGAADNCWVAKRQGSDAQLIFHTDPAWHFECFSGSTNPILGWYSVALEEKKPAVTLRGWATQSAARRCVTRIEIAEAQQEK